MLAFFKRGLGTNHRPANRNQPKTLFFGHLSQLVPDGLQLYSPGFVIHSLKVGSLTNESFHYTEIISRLSQVVTTLPPSKNCLCSVFTFFLNDCLF